MIRDHDGSCELLDDLDGDKQTITIRTKLFSTYAIIYTEGFFAEDETNMQWLWLLLAALVVLAVGMTWYYSRKRTRGRHRRG